MNFKNDHGTVIYTFGSSIKYFYKEFLKLNI